MLVSFAYRYVWLSDRACGISFMYGKNNKGPNTNPWWTRQIMGPASENTLTNETKKALFVR